MQLSFRCLNFRRLNLESANCNIKEINELTDASIRQQVQQQMQRTKPHFSIMITSLNHRPCVASDAPNRCLHTGIVLTQSFDRIHSGIGLVQ